MRLLSGLLVCAFLFLLFPTPALASWEYPESLEDAISPSGSDVDDPTAAAVSENGDAVCIWTQPDAEGDYQLFMSHRVSGVWHHPSSLEDYISFSGFDVGYYYTVDMDQDGNAIVVWDQDERLFKAEYRDGAWTWPEDMDDCLNPPDTVLYYYALAMDSFDRAVIVWDQEDGGGTSHIYKAEKRGVWTTPADLDDYISPSGRDAWGPEVAMSDNGNAIITWTGEDSSSYSQVFKAEYSGSSWAYPSGIDDYISFSDEEADIPAVAMDIEGNAILAWIQTDGRDLRLYKSQYNVETDSWVHPASQEDSLNPSDVFPDFFTLAMNQLGDAIVVYQDESISFVVYKSEYRDGVWSNPSDVSDTFTPPSLLPIYVYGGVAMADTGYTAASWLNFDFVTFNSRIQKAEYLDGVWDIPSREDIISFPETAAGEFSTVALSPLGEGVLLWAQEDMHGEQRLYLAERSIPKPEPPQAVPLRNPAALLMFSALLGLIGGLRLRHRAVRSRVTY